MKLHRNIFSKYLGTIYWPNIPLPVSRFTEIAPSEIPAMQSTWRCIFYNFLSAFININI